MVLILYRIGILLYGATIRLASIWSPKARSWVFGRRRQERAGLPDRGSSKRIWMHCASLGEYEMGRPMLELIKAGQPDVEVVVTFFSPSGFEHVQKDELLHHILYLPLDTPANAKSFLRQLRPDLVVFVKYEFWYYHLREIKAQQIPAILISAVIRDKHPFVKYAKRYFKSALETFNHIFVQDGPSAKNLKRLGFENVTIAGDTRFDRVIANRQNGQPMPDIKVWVGNDPVIMLGSSWPAEEEIFLRWMSASNFSGKAIIAPHDISPGHIQRLQKQFPTAALYSKNRQFDTNVSILIMDQIGKLSTLYRFATVAFIGGAFGPGLHNILEAATFGVPVVFGPEIDKFPEAKELINTGSAQLIKDSQGFAMAIEGFLSPTRSIEVSRNLISYVDQRSGGSEKCAQMATIILRNGA